MKVHSEFVINHATSNMNKIVVKNEQPEDITIYLVVWEGLLESDSDIPIVCINEVEYTGIQQNSYIWRYTIPKTALPESAYELVQICVNSHVKKSMFLTIANSLSDI